MTSFPSLKNPFILAPMEEVSGLPFRLLCRQFGASLAYTEMVSAHGVARQNPSTLRLIATIPEEHPVGIQFCGQTSTILLDAAQMIERMFDLVDINMGCPSPNIIKQGAGAALLKRKNKIKEIIETLATNLKIPVTAKIRSGYSKNEAVEIAKIVERAGASAVTVHARTAAQASGTKADWTIIQRVKEAASIPVIGNGDVFTPLDAEQLLKHCDAVMIARGAMRHPMLFRECVQYFETGKIQKATPQEKINAFFQYYALHQKYPYGGLPVLKKRAQDFTHGLPKSTELRNSITSARSEDALLKMLRDYARTLP